MRKPETVSFSSETRANKSPRHENKQLLQAKCWVLFVLQSMN